MNSNLELYRSKKIHAELKTVILCLKIDLVSDPIIAELLVKYILFCNVYNRRL